MAKTAATKNRKPKNKGKEQQQDKKPKERRVGVSLMPHQWRVGDEIVVSTLQNGTVDKTVKITQLETGYGCKNLHVNGNGCYDRSIPKALAFPASEAIMLDMGISRETIDDMKKGVEQ